MSNEEFELVRGSGNVFHDFGVSNADAEQLRSILAAQILTGIAAADFSRVRRANLRRFTIDRLITILNRLNRQVEFTVVVRPVSSTGQPLFVLP